VAVVNSLVESLDAEERASAIRVAALEMPIHESEIGSIVKAGSPPVKEQMVFRCPKTEARRFREGQTVYANDAATGFQMRAVIESVSWAGEEAGMVKVALNIRTYHRNMDLRGLSFLPPDVEGQHGLRE
jgi:predicted RecA/RadA family phage recombinase